MGGPSPQFGAGGTWIHQAAILQKCWGVPRAQTAATQEFTRRIVGSVVLVAMEMWTEIGGISLLKTK